LARCVRLLRAWRQDAVIFDEFLLLGVIALSYGVAIAAGALGFLAVFAAGLALRRADDISAAATSAVDKPPLTPSILNVNEQLERIVEVAIVLLVGAMISTGYWSMPGLLLAAVLFVAIRPLSVWLGVRDTDTGGAPRHLLSWFGIRGIGSVYYAVFYAGYELRDPVAEELLSVVFTVVAASIVVHGVSATPLLDMYRARRAGRRHEGAVSDK
jgi:NhaP-type Na+/H+ or K+/H+ antiporter